MVMGVTKYHFYLIINMLIFKKFYFHKIIVST